MSVNSVMIQGNLTKDPERSTTSGGLEIGKISIAHNTKTKGQKVTYFFNVTVFGKTAEMLQYFQKGSEIIVEGKLTQDKWVDKKTGANRSAVNIIGNLIHFTAKPKQDNAVLDVGATMGNTMPAEAKGDFTQISEADFLEDDEVPF